MGLNLSIAISLKLLYNKIMKEYTVYIEKDEDGVFVGSIPTIAGCYSQGSTVDELMQNMQEVITLCLRNSDNSEVSGTFIGVQKMSVTT